VGARHFVVACVIVVGFFDYANNVGHVNDWMNVCFV